MKPLALLLSASLMLGSWAGAPAASAQTAPGPTASPFVPALSFFSRWLLEPDAMAMTAGIDPYLADLAQPQLLADGFALGPLVRVLERQEGGRRPAFLRSLLNVALLPRPEQAELVRALSAARKAAAGEAEASLRGVAASIRSGGTFPEDAVAFSQRSWAFRLYGEGAESGAAELQRAVAEARIGAVRRRAQELLRSGFAGRGDPSFLETALPDTLSIERRPPEHADRPASFYRPAALGGSPEALFALGGIHEAQGSEAGRAKAYGWYVRASVLGHAEAPSALLRLLPRVSPRDRGRAESEAAWHLAQLASRAPGKAEPPKGRSDLLPRIATAALLVPALAGSIHLGGAAFSALVVAIAGLSCLEYGAMLEKGRRPVQRGLLVASGAALALAPALGLAAGPFLAASAAAATLVELFRKEHSFERAALTLFGAVLLGFLPAHLILLRGLPSGERLALWVFASAWVADTLGYLIGKPFGRHKIWDVSPNKSWEGSIAGFAGSLGVAAAFWAFSPGLLSLPGALALGALLGVSGQLSGFASSMIKRAVGVKDSGKLLPGHGGVVDRFDSYILSAAVAYYFLLLLQSV